MQVEAMGLAPVPPLRLLWRASESLVSAVPSGSVVYGLNPEGHLVSIHADTGATRWKNSAGFYSNRLTVDGTTIFVFQKELGLVAVEDKGTSFAEKTVYELGLLKETDFLGQPVVAGQLVHTVLNNRLLAIDKAGGGLRFEASLTDEGPYTLTVLNGDLISISGAGRVTRWRVNASSYSVVWQSSNPAGDGLAERDVTIAENLVIVADRAGVTAYNAANGSRRWSQSGVGNLAIAVSGDAVYCAGNQAALWALNLSNGGVRWDRKYLAFAQVTPRVGLAFGDDHLWVGALLADGNEPAALFAVNKTDGGFAWQATGVTLFFGNGLPVVAGGRVLTFGSSEPLSGMGELGGAPAVTLANIKQSPNPLRGAMAGFNPVEVEIRLSVSATVSFIAWHERDVRNNPVGPISYSPGRHFINYDARWPRGWTDINQFGRLAVQIEEKDSGLKYTQVLLVPVNTLPDIHHHWGQKSIEAMIYHQYIGGYPDLTFRPNNLVTRAESSTIIAKTLGLEKPSASFKTKFIDIDGHWARNHIMALEEKEIVGGFLEPDGTYTFRPGLMMTRAQEARILVKAYNVQAAPASFQSRFKDIRGHWAEPDVRALEFAGYVNGFRETDGSYTYRPEQNLTRAELSTVVVRIRKLSKP